MNDGTEHSEQQKQLGGRPTSLTPEVQATFCDAVKEGLTYRDACILAGIEYQTYRNWMRRGEAGEGEFFVFFDAVTRAKVEGKRENIKGVRDAGKFDWRARAWILEKQHPEEYGNIQRIKVEVEREIQGILDALEGRMSTAAYDELLDALGDMGKLSKEEEGAEE